MCTYRVAHETARLFAEFRFDIIVPKDNTIKGNGRLAKRFAEENHGLRVTNVKDKANQN